MQMLNKFDVCYENTIFSISEDVVKEESSQLRVEGIRRQVDQVLEGGLRAH